MKEVFKKLFGRVPMSAEDREAFAVCIPVALCLVVAFCLVALVAENEQQAMEIGRKRLDAFTDAEIGQEAQFGHLEVYTL